MIIKHPRLLLPNHLYDEFPTDHESEQADSLLASWTALWHPAILANSESVPNWTRPDDLNTSLDGFLIVVPAFATEELDDRLRRRLQDEDALLIVDTPSRSIILDQILSSIGLGDANPSQADLDPDVLADFFALGYCYLQIELLTKHMRHSSGVSESSLDECLKTAAKTALSEESSRDAVRDQLISCFDVLTQEREHYYAVDVFLLDIALLDEKLGPKLITRQLESTHTFNFLASGRTIEALQEHDAIIEAIKTGIEQHQVGVITGEYADLQIPLSRLETVLANFQKGRAMSEKILGAAPAVYGRRTFGLSPSLPQLLTKLGFQGALHATFDDGQFPEATQTKSRWEGNDGTGIDAIMRAPLDATKSSTFLGLASKISDSMDMDHVATKGLVHWAGTMSPWFEELRRTAKYTSALGKFVTAQEYFQETYDPGMHDCFTADRYRSPYLTQAIHAKKGDPLSSSVRYCQREVRIQQLSALTLLARLLETEANACFSDRVNAIRDRMLSLLGEPSESFDREIEEFHAAVRDALQAHLIPSGDTRGIMYINAFSYPVRVFSTTDAKAVNLEKPVYAFQPNCAVITDTSGMGFAWVPFKSGAATVKSNQPKLIEDNSIRNEFLEAVVDQKTGGIRFVRDFKNRGNRLSLQLAMRLTNVVEENDETYASCYTKMVASEVYAKSDTPAFGEIVAQGKLLDRSDEPVASFSQTVRLERGSRVLQLSIEIDPIRLPEKDPWNSYYCIRSAWPNEATELFASLNDTRQPMSARRFEAPFFCDLDDGVSRTSLITGGLPFHRRVGRRMLDSLLLVDGESQRHFNFGIGIDLRNPFREAQRLHELPLDDVSTGSENGSNGWLFHIDATNVIATSWWPIQVDDNIVGLIVRLIETEGKSTNAKISAFRNVASARKVDYAGETIDHCENTETEIHLSMHGYEWTELEMRFEHAT